MMRTRLLTCAWALLCAAALADASVRTASVYIQPVILSSSSSSPPPTLLAEVRYETEQPQSDTANSSSGGRSTTTLPAEVSSYEAPEIPEGADLVRVGVFDPRTGDWASPVSVASASNFAKGYSPHIVLTVDSATSSSGGGGGGSYLGVSCRGVRIDAGATRDFGPQAVVAVAAAGKQPELNRPVVLSPEGKKVAPPEEKTFLQKYWWLIGIAMLMLVTSGGSDAK